MAPIFRRLRIFSGQNEIAEMLCFALRSRPRNRFSQNLHFSHSKARDFVSLDNQKPETLFNTKASLLVRSFPGSAEAGDRNEDEVAVWIQNILKFRREKPAEEIEKALDRSGVAVTERLLLNVLRRHRSDWRLALVFFNWASNGGSVDGFKPGRESHNEIIDILGKMRRFEDAHQVLDKMSERKGLVNEVTYSILLNRLASAHKVEEAIDVFRRRKDFGIEVDSVAFETLLMWLCRYKHVEVAETLFYSMPSEFRSGIKAWNIVLNGWCVRGNVHEAKRFWKDIVGSQCSPDLFTYGTFINALTKKGKLGSAMKLFRAMWENGLNPDATICNSMIDALCFKKRIPEALELLQEMQDRGCEPNVATYNSLIKHMCKIRRMENVYKILDKMEEEKGSVSPNHVTFGFLLKSLRKPEEVNGLLERMERNGVGMTSDAYNLILKLYMEWDCQEEVRITWNEMERSGFGPDERSYTVMIHGLYKKGRTRDALRYYKEMKSKGMEPEPRTQILMNSGSKDGKK